MGLARRIVVFTLRASGVSLAAVAFLGTALSANAQSASTVEVGVGYAHLSRIDDISLPKGLYGSVGWRLTQWLSVVGEVGWQERHEVFDNFFSDTEVSTILGGARFVPWSSERIVPFTEFLVGAAHDKYHVAEIEPNPFFPGLDLELSVTGLALQPGGGVVFWLHPHVGAQVTLHYRRTVGRSLGRDFDLRDISDLWFATGLTVGFGRRR